MLDLLSNFSGPLFTPFLQILLALIFGMILGIERVLAGRTAGPRTYGLVSIGSCLATIISISAIKVYHSAPSANPFQVIEGVITGVGFIGAGLIIFRDSKLSGLTTAAGIWVASIIGISVGFQMYTIAAFTTFLTLFVFSIMWRVETMIKNHFVEHPQHLHQDNEE